MSTARIRAAAWLVALAAMAIGLFAMRMLPSGSRVDRFQLALVFLPHTIAVLALLLLAWIGAFPPSWPWIGKHGRRQCIFAGVMSAVALPALGLVWLKIIFAVF